MNDLRESLQEYIDLRRVRKNGLPATASATGHMKSVMVAGLAAYRVPPLSRAIPV